MVFQSLREKEELYKENGILYLLKVQNFLIGLENWHGSHFLVYLLFFAF